MDWIVRAVGRQVRRARGVERFVRLIVVGGVALVAGLWTMTLSGAWSPPWLLGVLSALLGTVGLAGGIRLGLESGPAG